MQQLDESESKSPVWRRVDEGMRGEGGTED